MKLIRQLEFTILAMVFVAVATNARAATIPVTGWAAHNQSSPVTVITNETTNSPTMTPADQALTVMGTFPSVNLANDGDFIKLSLTLQWAAASAIRASTPLTRNCGWAYTRGLMVP
jgi:hypothetical protein